MQVNAINPLKDIAHAVKPACKGNTRVVWHKKQESNKYSGAPQATGNKEWHKMSTWKTLLTIEDKIADGNYFSPTAPEDLKLTAEEVKALKQYCLLIIDQNTICSSFKSFLIHGFKREGWISNTGKAAQLYNRIKDIEQKRLYPKKYDHAYEYVQKGPSGRSRIYELEQKNYQDLSTEKRGVGFINGICNNFDQAKECLAYVSDMENVKIRAVYNATHGIFADLKESWYGWFGYSTRPSRMVIKLWDEFFDQHQINGKDDPDARFLMIAHSQGAVHVKNALKVYPKERRDRIEILMLAPGVYPNPKLCGDIITYRVYWDFITWFDYKAGERKAKDKIINLRPGNKHGPVNHLLMSGTYTECLKTHLNAFKTKGTLWLSEEQKAAAHAKAKKPAKATTTKVN